MFKPLSVLVISVLVLTSCATVRDSRVNPFNWFGRSSSAPVQNTNASGTENPLIPARAFNGRNLLGIRTKNEPEVYNGRPIAQVSDLTIERRPGGAIIRATGIADRIGPFDARLVPVPEETVDGTLSYSLRALQQAGPRDASPAARSVVVAVWVTDQDLAPIRTIRVSGRDNAQVTRR